jgi:hypothetical protein
MLGEWIGSEHFHWIEKRHALHDTLGWYVDYIHLRMGIHCLHRSLGSTSTQSMKIFRLDKQHPLLTRLALDDSLDARCSSLRPLEQLHEVRSRACQYR